MKPKGLFPKQHHTSVQSPPEQSPLLWQSEKMFPEQLLLALLFNGEERGRKENSSSSSSSITCSSVGVLTASSPHTSSPMSLPETRAGAVASPLRNPLVSAALHGTGLWLCRSWLRKGSSPGCGTWAKHCFCCTGCCGHFAGSSARTQACLQKSPTGVLTGSYRGNQWDGDGLQPPGPGPGSPRHELGLWSRYSLPSLTVLQYLCA